MQGLMVRIDASFETRFKVRIKALGLRLGLRARIKEQGLRLGLMHDSRQRLKVMIMARFKVMIETRFKVRIMARFKVRRIKARFRGSSFRVCAFRQGLRLGLRR